MKVMQTFKPVKFKIETIYPKSPSMRKPKLIDTSLIVDEIKKCLIKNLTLHLT